MNHITHTLCIAALWAMGCGQLERSNPYDTHGQQAEQPTAAIALQVPMAKALAIVVYRVEAILAGPSSPTITKQLDISPLGPATGIIGTSAPGEGFSLTLRGYDTEGALLFEGGTENITIVEGDTVLVEIELYLTRAIPGLGDAADSSDDNDEADSTPDDGADSSADPPSDTSSEPDTDASADVSENDAGGTGSDAEEEAPSEG